MPKGRPPIFPPRRPSSVVRYLLVIFLILTILYAFNHRTPTHSSHGLNHGPEARPPTQAHSPPNRDEPFEGPEEKLESGSTTDTSSSEDEKAPKENDKEVTNADANTDSSSNSSFASDPNEGHPIGKLIYDAQFVFAELMSKESRTIEDAAQAYRKRRGRHPPPGFDRWYDFAREKNAVIVEDFFDQIYDDLGPFWGMDPSILRKESWDFEMTIHIRDGKAESGSDWFWTVIWLNLIKTIEHLLPDMDLALNAMDEPRLVVPWEDIEGYMKKAAGTMKLPKAKNVRGDHQKLPEPGKGDPVTVTRDKNWENTRMFMT